MKTLAVLGIKMYRNLFSIYQLQSCRFFPSCSHYAEEAISRFGVWRGLLKTGFRLLRCQPFSRGGYDPVISRGDVLLPGECPTGERLLS